MNHRFSAIFIRTENKTEKKSSNDFSIDFENLEPRDWCEFAHLRPPGLVVGLLE
jgi:hypothetical protein